MLRIRYRQPATLWGRTELRHAKQEEVSIHTSKSTTLVLLAGMMCILAVPQLQHGTGSCHACYGVDSGTPASSKSQVFLHVAILQPSEHRNVCNDEFALFDDLWWLFMIHDYFSILPSLPFCHVDSFTWKDLERCALPRTSMFQYVCSQ